mmetsp:Transcript_5206/g.11620  ORF Transcript_5206/g.11620 Transcript_5206/m.11620 type:complete len:259 (-) Transcript_5206:446-1222(-)|eukprot:CAMPEP_0182560980 /NCGR_PEP_ID=MMETSP1324-20130603/3536_1 /TAXON_ID=236786 /ORGANISM="Florenciella sp., Strain RCC1587" /LENGTH=258 /DNA_ID=CAMNT_0024773465 /DNA_START=41 /DNA_END=817 /DNA_ORIENTATION=-
MSDVAADVADLKALLARASRPRSRKVLSAELRAAEDEAAALAAAEVEATVLAETPPVAPAAAAAEAPSPPPPRPLPAVTGVVVHTPRATNYTAISSFGWDAGEYNSAYVTIYVTLEGVGSVKDSVECEFKKDSFDLRVHGLNGKSYRLLKDNLEKDIVPDDCKTIVKKNKVTIKLKKVKGEFSYDHWTTLTSKKGKVEKKKSAADPMGGIMDMMKDMYQDGDDDMKKIIAESMMKAQSGEKTEPGMGGGMGDFGLGGV